MGIYLFISSIADTAEGICMVDDVVKAAIYCRVSTDDQSRRGYSMSAQERRVRAYAEARGWEVVGVYSDARSGKSLRRPGYLRMLEASGSWDVLMVWKIDRVHRNALNFSRMLAALQSAGKSFVAVYEELDSTTVYGAFAMDIIARLAQLESEQLGERVLDGMAQKVRSGGFLGRVPFGYRKGEGGGLEASPEAPLVREAYVLRSEGAGYADLARRLNLLGDGSVKWDGRKVRRMIASPVYAGYVRWNGIVAEGAHAPIVPLDLWEDVNGHIQMGG